MRRFFCCGSKKADASKIYLPGFINRSMSMNPITETPLLPLRQLAVTSPNTLSISCVERGEVCTGLGYIAECVRYPPNATRPFWTTSYSVWLSRNQAGNNLYWRIFISDVVAFFYIIDATDRARIDLARAEIETFTDTTKLPNFIAVIFLNRAAEKDAMSREEVDKVLGISGSNCLGYFIQPIRPLGRNDVKKALGWLYDRLIENGTEAPPIFPAETPRRKPTPVDHLPLPQRAIDLRPDSASEQIRSENGSFSSVQGKHATGDNLKQTKLPKIPEE